MVVPFPSVSSLQHPAIMSISAWVVDDCTVLVRVENLENCRFNIIRNDIVRGEL